MRTSAPGTTAPEASTIVPLITPVVSCANTQEVNTKATTEADATTRRFMKHLTRKLEGRITNCRQFVQGHVVGSSAASHRSVSNDRKNSTFPLVANLPGAGVRPESASARSAHPESFAHASGKP